MKTYLSCYPCFLRQALDAARMVEATEDQQRQVVRATLSLLQDLDATSTPPEIGDRIHRLVREMVDHGDPYREVKDRATAQALALYPDVKARCRTADDPLELAIRAAIAGNIIDFGPGSTYELEATLDRVLTTPFTLGDLAPLRTALARAESVLYLADNAGETVFDRLLIEALPVPVTYAVKGGPILNDATLADAQAAGLGEVADLVTTGSDAPGTLLHRCKPDFRRRFEEATLILAKGQANYETLSPGDDRIFFLLQAKCPVIAEDIGVPVQSIILRHGGWTEPAHQSPPS
jgi:damage-control phosphatase, subfamily I